MKTFRPVNGHIEVAPIEQEGFMASQKETYEEKGVVVSTPNSEYGIEVGDTVYFDAWLCAKYPTEEPGKFRWLVHIDNIRAIEREEVAE